jgi:hypothetical protein
MKALFFLKELRIAKTDHVFAHPADKLGSLLMICARMWGADLNYEQDKIVKF